MDDMNAKYLTIFESEDERLMTIIADQVAIALNCARILEETQLASPSASNPEMADDDKTVAE